MVTKFSRAIPPYDFLNQLKDIWEEGQIRPDAFIFLRKDKSGKISGMEGSSLQQDDDIAAIDAIIATIASRSLGASELASIKAAAALADAAAGDFGLSANDMRALAEKLQPNESAIVILFENVWERRFREAAAERGGEVVNQRFISPKALTEAAARLVASDAFLPGSLSAATDRSLPRSAPLMISERSANRNYLKGVCGGAELSRGG